MERRNVNMTLKEYSKILAENGNNPALRDKTYVASPNFNACDYYRNHLPKGPSGASIDDNIAEARSWNFLPIFPFGKAVYTHNRWDYKDKDSSYENFGNVNYGATGRAIGIPRRILQAGAGLAQYNDGTHKPEYGSFFSSTFGDDPKDQEQIKLGMDYFDACFEK